MSAAKVALSAKAASEAASSAKAGKVANFDLKWAGHHDTWNIAWLTIVVSVNIYFLLHPTPENLQLFSLCFSTYIAADFVWIVALPGSVSSPTTIKVHHCITLSIISVMALVDFELGKLMAFTCLVEGNTLSRILRKNYRESELVNFFFYSSWIFCRLIVGPYSNYHLCLGVVYPDMYKSSSLSDGTNTILKTMIFSCSVPLTLMNFKWSYDLFVLGGSRLRSRKGL